MGSTPITGIPYTLIYGTDTVIKTFSSWRRENLTYSYSINHVLTTIANECWFMSTSSTCNNPYFFLVF